MTTTPNSKSFQTTISNLMQIAESSPKWVENTVGKGEIARTSNFSFSHSVFKRPVLQTRKNQGLFGKGLKVHFVYSQGMAYLEERGIVHRDLAARNVLGKFVSKCFQRYITSFFQLVCRPFLLYFQLGFNPLYFCCQAYLQ